MVDVAAGRLPDRGSGGSIEGSRRLDGVVAVVVAVTAWRGSSGAWTDDVGHRAVGGKPGGEYCVPASTV